MFMLDTNICIYLINERDEALRERFEANAREICISSITYAELCYGVAHSARVARNARELEAFRLDLDIRSFDQGAGITTARFVMHWRSAAGPSAPTIC